MLSAIITAAWKYRLPSIMQAPGCCNHRWQASAEVHSLCRAESPDTRHLLGENTFANWNQGPVDWNLPFNNGGWYRALVHSSLIRKGCACSFYLSILLNKIYCGAFPQNLVSPPGSFALTTSAGLRNEKTQVQVLALLLILCVILDELLYLPEPPLPPWKNWDKKPTWHSVYPDRLYNCRITKEI